MNIFRKRGTGSGAAEGRDHTKRRLTMHIRSASLYTP